MPDPVAAPQTATQPTSGDQPSTSQTPSNALPPSHVSRRTLGGPQRVIQRQPSKTNAPIAPTAAPATIAPKVGAAEPAAEPAVGAAETHSPASPGSSADSAVPAEPAKPEETKLTAAEESRRLARINRADQRLQAERRSFAQEKQQHAQAMQRAQALEQHYQTGHREAHADPLAFLQRTFGISPQSVLDRVISEGAKPEATRMQEASAQQAAQLQAQIKAIQEEQQRGQREFQAQKQAADLENYKRQSIAPVVADASKYALLHTYCKAQGLDPVNEVFAGIEARYRATGGKQTLQPSQVADILEKHLRSQRDLLSGVNVTPAKLTEPPRTAPAKANGAQTATRSAAYAPPVKQFKIRAKA
jgi:hypothetical protein